MTLIELTNLTRLYCRDNNNNMFSDARIKIFLNQAIDRIRQYKVFANMPYLEANDDEVQYLPEYYHYILALFASHRCYDTDERFYEGVEKRNEFESAFSELINEIESGNISISDSDGETVRDMPNYIEYIKDEYFRPCCHRHHHHIKKDKGSDGSGNYEAMLADLQTGYGLLNDKINLLAVSNTVDEMVIPASGWSNKQYIFVNYQDESYDVICALNGEIATEEQISAWNAARIFGSKPNRLIATGEVPKVDIPVVLKIEQRIDFTTESEDGE